MILIKAPTTKRSSRPSVVEKGRDRLVEPVILLVSQAIDTHTTAVAQALARLGAPYARLDTETFPEQARITLTVRESCSGTALAGLTGDFTECAIDAIGAALYRRPERPAFSEPLELRYTEFATAEASACLEALYGCLEGRWLNEPFRMRRARDKLLQLRLAAELGFEVPQTIVTNDPSAVPAEAPVVYKTLRSQSISDAPGQPPLGLFTTLLSQELRAELGRLKYAPGIFQAFVEKAADLRITICGDYVYACQIDSQLQDDAVVDFRNAEPFFLPHRIINLPSGLVTRLQLLLRALGLRFGCVDMALTPDGRHVFFEINSNGQWLWIEDITAAPIADSIARTLIAIAAKKRAHSAVADRLADYGKA